jgi:phage recombination protein Bet
MPANAEIKPQQWRVLTDAIFPNAKTAESVMMALEYCRVRNLDPFKRPVHIVPMYSTASRKMIETVWPGINELQVTAARSGAWAGMDEPVWGPEQTLTFEGAGDQDENGDPVAARKITIHVAEWCSVTVYRIVGGQRVAFSEPVYWSEAYARAARNTDMPNAMWLKRPKGQHIKCAKAASLRAAFPEDLGSTYAAEEMEDRETDATGPVIDGKAETQQRTAPIEEESEFMVRAVERLDANIQNASAWLKALIGLLGECPTAADLASLCAFHGVQKARKDAPILIRAQIEDAITAAGSRLAEAVHQPILDGEAVTQDRAPTGIATTQAPADQAGGGG